MNLWARSAFCFNQVSHICSNLVLKVVLFSFFDPVSCLLLKQKLKNALNVTNITDRKFIVTMDSNMAAT